MGKVQTPDSGHGMDGYPGFGNFEQSFKTSTDIPPPTGSTTDDADPASPVHGKCHGLRQYYRESTLAKIHVFVKRS